MLTNYIISLRVFFWLLWTDLKPVALDMHNSILDSASWAAAIIIVGGIIFPSQGMSADMGAMSTIGLMMIAASFTAWYDGIGIKADLEGARSIAYRLSLPLPYWMVYLVHVICFTFKSTICNLVALIIGKLVVGFALPLNTIPSFALVYLASNILFALFALWATFWSSTLANQTRMELRLTGPLWFLSGMYSSWWATYHAWHLLGIVLLLSPWTYVYEGNRAALLGQAGFLNYWLSLAMIIGWGMVFAVWGLRLFKERLDCV